MSEVVSSPSFPGLEVCVDDGGLTQRRVRHITTIQVRNLTPFPVRDAFASALAQPAGQSQFNPHGQLSDDLDVTLSRRRGRRVSINSLWSMRSEEGPGDGPVTPGMKGRRRAGSGVSLSGLGQGSSASGSFASLGRTSSTAPTVRAQPRHRTISITSSGQSIFVGPGSVAPSASAASIGPFSILTSENSQTSLEKVIRSRLVETFLAITVPPISASSQDDGGASSGTRSATMPRRTSSPSFPFTPPKSAPLSREKNVSGRGTTPVPNGTAPRPTAKSSPLKPANKPTGSLRRGTTSAAGSPRGTAPRPLTSPQKSLPKSFPRLNGKPSASSIISRASSSTPSPPSSPKRRHAPLPVAAPATAAPAMPLAPNYLSSIHRPSTNPSFTIDAASGYEFADWTDLGAQKLKIELWGKVGVGWRGDGRKVEGKGKEKEVDGGPRDDVEWTVLEEWNVDLSHLVPLPDELAANTASLASNTLLITLSLGQTFYLPQHHPSTRPPSPSAGYASDPELEVRRVKHREDLTASSSSMSKLGEDENEADPNLFVRRRHRGSRRTGQQEESLKTVAWKDLFELVTLQSGIADNQSSLSDVVSAIDKAMKEDVVSQLKREVLEREARVEELGGYIKHVRVASDELRDRIQCRREQLEERRQMLTAAKEQEEEFVSEEVEREMDVANARDRLRSLRANLPPTRTTLLTTLSSIFPIELLSPPDLLYTILDVPLPIPVSASDPAPPLSLASHKEVTDDAVATALGFVAQVVQVVAAYLGKGLVYPVTCVGSRSLIRDGISAMVGPRMFPLYSRGVDTYRFEYGVFLLNKDIELLMADRDLRAMDMRHTLPNLKNLLLTLTNGEGAPLRSSGRTIRPQRSSGSLDSLASAPAGGPSDGSELSCKRPGTPITESEGEVAGNATENGTPPESGTITPTGTVSERKSQTRGFLVLPPLSGLLRGTSWIAKSEEEENDESDRRTIRGE